MSIKDKVVVITGASSGIGRATAKLLATKGANVVLGARREDRLKDLVAEIGSKAVYQVTDVTQRAQVHELLQLALTRFGHIDVLYNNAGTMPQGNLSDREYDKWQMMLNVNIMGVLNGIGEILPIMQRQRDGLIITTDSVAGHVVYPASAVYNGTKYAVRAIMEGLRQEEKQNGIRSTIISPGAVRTELVNTIGNATIEANIKQLMDSDGDRMLSLDPEDIANAVLFAIDQPKHVAISEVMVRPTGQEV
ncbi:SDR family oxidoreductase [Levilactobacillus brevis]|uniref:SDR family oxidoreductase n=1 Tax=Levilactobacillus brevis TaxID=1580 RepID=UPI000A20B799|nr:SDR family oxidoreductase [Levilactobacillus brevis]ARN90112.1 oxidoreductase [Levilactobacillus brevis]ARN97752.1 oxidoreductase [Levilactobacillus brevis]MCF7523630.1 SDR family oxidoreductase [Levilactobacillus brevis]TOY85236.1 SDR family NAD(P)-dependent oxidoreductase [Levilactobacillus brevis]HJD99536.1 SDR family oxidoreductase [Levilactobacillus brevis]